MHVHESCVVHYFFDFHSTYEPVSYHDECIYKNINYINCNLIYYMYMYITAYIYADNFIYKFNLLKKNEEI